MVTLEKLKKEYNTISMFFATILIIPFQTLLFIPVSMDSLSALENSEMSLFPESQFVMVIYVLLPIFYCIIVSLFFHPKRLISPINVQIGTVIVYSTIVIYHSSTLVDLTFTTYLNLFGSIFILASIAIMIGIFQFIIVRWVVGLNLDSVDRSSYIINGKLKDIMKALDGDFISVWGLSRRKENPKAKKPIWILKRKDIFNNHIIIAIGSHPENEEKCILATTSFHLSNLGISKTEKSSARRDSILNDIECRLKKTGLQLSIIPITEINDTISYRAYAHAIKVTNSKIDIVKGFFKNLPKYYKWAIIITILIFVIITVGCYLEYIDFNTYVGVVIVIIITLFIEVGSLVREELLRKNIEELD